MTTNAGASDMAREAVGFGAMTREGEDEEAIKRMFTPEFRNRLDATVPFGYLPPEVVARVVTSSSSSSSCSWRTATSTSTWTTRRGSG
jgi:ATP-dependent Clp protease ATP-binding subunit ClpA